MGLWLSELINGKVFTKTCKYIIGVGLPMKFTYDDFKDYLSRVSKLYTLTLNFIRYYDNVVKQANGKNVHELQEDIRNMVLSGLKPDGEYTENAYALFVKDFMGLYIEDPKLYVSKLKLEAKPNVKVLVEETRFIEFVRLLNKVSKFIMDKAKELNLSSIDAGIQESNTKQQNIEDLIAELIKTSYDLSVGVNAFSTGVWGLRKITPQYMKKAYENVSEDLLKVLGLSKLLNIKEYEIWGFPDYFTKCMLYEKLVTVYTGYHYYAYYLSINGIPVLSESLREVRTTAIEPKTLGGAICILNEIIWRYTNLLHGILSKWYEGVVNVEEEYIEEAWKSLNEIGWGIPEYLKIGVYEVLYADFKNVLVGDVGSSRGSPFKFLVYDEDGAITKYIQWIYRGSYDRSEFSEYKLSQYVLLPELFDEMLPAIFLGVIDVTLYLNDEKALLILVRTKSGG